MSASVRARSSSIRAWPLFAPETAKSSPGFHLPSLVREYVRAPEQARLTLLTSPPMWTSADFERWHPGVASAPPASLYAPAPSASVFDADWFVLPAQRPASPEIAESPTETTVSAEAAAGKAAARQTAASGIQRARIGTLLVVRTRWSRPRARW